MGSSRGAAQGWCAAILAASALLGSPGVAGAQEDVVRRYYGAIEAAEQCEHRQFDQTAHEKMVVVINRNGGSEIPFNRRMALISESRNEAKDVIQKFGCKSDKVAELLQLFHADLEPAL